MLLAGRTGENRQPGATDGGRAQAIDRLGDDVGRPMLLVNRKLRALPPISDLAKRIADHAVQKGSASGDAINSRSHKPSHSGLVATTQSVIEADVGRQRERLGRCGQKVGRQSSGAGKFNQRRGRVSPMAARCPHRFQLPLVGPSLDAGNANAKGTGGATAGEKLHCPVLAQKSSKPFRDDAAIPRGAVAQEALRLDANVPGDFFVDTTCIDCDACRQIAPGTFRDAGEQSAVYRQPETAGEILAAQKALVACPTASIGDVAKRAVSAAIASYPELVAADVYRCGFTAESSFGAFSYLIRGPRGNTLIDSPRFTAPLAKNIEAIGGVRRMLLTHQDDVADHQKFHDRFACERVLHREDVRSHTAMVERKPEGKGIVEIEPGLLMIPTPGHTRGHSVFLWRETFLFTGDHLAWSESRGHLYAFRNACWYSWPQQIESMRRLLGFRFEWVLPGHGRPIHLPADAMRASLERCVEWMGVTS